MWKGKTGTHHTNKTVEPEVRKEWEGPLGGPPSRQRVLFYTIYASTLWMVGTFPPSRGLYRPQTILSKDYFMTFQWQFKGGLVLTTCSSPSSETQGLQVRMTPHFQASDIFGRAILLSENIPTSQLAAPKSLRMFDKRLNSLGPFLSRCIKWILEYHPWEITKCDREAAEGKQYFETAWTPNIVTAARTLVFLFHINLKYTLCFFPRMRTFVINKIG